MMDGVNLTKINGKHVYKCYSVTLVQQYDNKSEILKKS
jgi:hypothetical protein